MYLKVTWIHDFDDEPVLLYSEVDENNFESRKVEIYKDNRFGLAMHNYDFGGTLLGSEPVPAVSEIAEDPQFIPVSISKEEFEEIWVEYTFLLSLKR